MRYGAHQRDEGAAVVHQGELGLCVYDLREWQANRIVRDHKLLQRVARAVQRKTASCPGESAGGSGRISRVVV